MILNYSVSPSKPGKENPPPFDHLRISLPNNFSVQEVEEITVFLTTYFLKNHNFQVYPFTNPRSSQKGITKKISLSHFYSYSSFVKIRHGVLDSDLDFDLSGMVGQIVQFYRDENDELFFIQWTKNSFEKIKKNVLYDLKHLGRPWIGTFIDKNDLLPIHYSESLDFVDHSMVNAYLNSIKGEELNFWKHKILPILDKKHTSFYAWEQVFSDLLVSTESVYIKPDQEDFEQKTTSIIHSAGYDSIHGVWIRINQRDQKEIVIPLSSITAFSNQELHQNLQYYQNWVKLFCPEA